MGLKLIRFVSLLLSGLATGVVFTHVLEASNKTELSGPVYLAVQQVLLQDFGQLAGLVEGGAVLSTLALLFMIRRDGPVLVLTLIGFLCLAAMIFVWTVWINPINVQVNAWTPETLPLNWTEFRDHWAFFHAIRACLALIGLSALILAVLADMPIGTRATRITLPVGSLNRR